MGHGHGGHGHGAPKDGSAWRPEARRRLSITLALTTTYMVAELVGGLLTGSLALLADAGHMLSDTAALGLSLFAIRFAQKPATSQHTFGFYRTEILAALGNGAGLLVIATLIVWEAVERLTEPSQVLGLPMMIVAAGGLAMNLIAMWLLHGGKSDSMNVRGAWLHVVTDAMGSVGAIVAGLLVWGLGWTWADPVASILIVLLVVYSAWTLVRDAIFVLMEGAPENVDVDAVRSSLSALPSVVEVHDLHVWVITSGMPSASVHLVTDIDVDRDAALWSARRMLAERFGITHTTIQVERQDDADCPGCAAQ